MYATTETAQVADLVLPAAGWGEKDGTFINSERRIGLLKKVARAPGSLGVGVSQPGNSPARHKVAAVSHVRRLWRRPAPYDSDLILRLMRELLMVDDVVAVPAVGPLVAAVGTSNAGQDPGRASR